MLSKVVSLLGLYDFNLWLFDQKSYNLLYNMLGCWVDCLIDQESDGPSIILIDEKKTVGCWLGLRALKTLYFYFCKFIKKNWTDFCQEFCNKLWKKIILGTSFAWLMRRLSHQPINSVHLLCLGLSDFWLTCSQISLEPSASGHNFCCICYYSSGIIFL
jgi:hypothetical protein